MSLWLSSWLCNSRSSAYLLPSSLWFDASREGVKQRVSAFSDLLPGRVPLGKHERSELADASAFKE